MKCNNNKCKQSLTSNRPCQVMHLCTSAMQGQLNSVYRKAVNSLAQPPARPFSSQKLLLLKLAPLSQLCWRGEAWSLAAPCTVPPAWFNRPPPPLSSRRLTFQHLCHWHRLVGVCLRTLYPGSQAVRTRPNGLNLSLPQFPPKMRVNPSLRGTRLAS